MRNKFLGLIALVCLVFFSVVNVANALIYSQQDVYYSISKLRKLATEDMISMINKTEIIGYRYDNFKIVTMQYQRNVAAAADNLQNIASRIELIENSTDYSDTEKDMQVQKLYQEADATISKVHTVTIDYVIGLNQLPSITYQKFVKKFQAFYNDLGLTDSDINIQK